MNAHATAPAPVAAGRTGTAATKAGTAATVFGLDVRSERPLALIGQTPAPPTGRPLQIELAGTAPRGAWPATAPLVCNQREHDGSVSFRIHADDRRGYLISGPAYGSHLLAPGGEHLVCAPGRLADGAWQRLLIAQVLPFAALLQGLEPLHASAVATAQGAIALTGPSGAGKTSIALELCRHGARFLADDVLVLERADSALIAHPGTPLAGVPHTATPAFPSTPEIVAANERERLVRIPSTSNAAPLAAIFFLDRHRDGPSTPRFEAETDPQRLLGATFNSVLISPERLRELLHVCALAAASCRVERVAAGPRVDARRLGEAIARRTGVEP